MKAAPKVACVHPLLHFENGGLYVVCSNPECGQAWQAVVANRLTPDFTAWGWGLSPLEERRKP